jgi:very-short-patch-repair endonuclease
LITFNNDKKLIIELDGLQHFKQVRNWKSPLHYQIRDKYKEFKARKYKIPLIRCFQEDVYHNKNQWNIKLEKQLKKYY